MLRFPVFEKRKDKQRLAVYRFLDRGSGVAGRWKGESGKWKVESGGWEMVTGEW
jgi:hypothetical protein